MATKINVTVTPYDGDEFPEAASYPEYVATRLAAIYPGSDVSVEVGSRTKAHVYQDDMPDSSDMEAEVARLARVELWDDFCGDGYRAYTA